MEKPETYQARYKDFRVVLEKHSNGWLLKVFKGELSDPVEGRTIPGYDLDQAKVQASAIVYGLARLESHSDEALPEAPGRPEPVLLFFDEADALFGKRTRSPSVGGGEER